MLKWARFVFCFCRRRIFFFFFLFFFWGGGGADFAVSVETAQYGPYTSLFVVVVVVVGGGGGGLVWFGLFVCLFFVLFLWCWCFLWEGSRGHGSDGQLGWFIFITIRNTKPWNYFQMCTVVLWTKIVVECMLLWSGLQRKEDSKQNAMRVAL